MQKNLHKVEIIKPYRLERDADGGGYLHKVEIIKPYRQERAMRKARAIYTK